MTTEPIHILSLGAGVQSSTLALMAAAGEVNPMPVVAIFADTQDESKATYIFLDWLEKNISPIRLVRVTKGKLSEHALRLRTSRKTGLHYTKPQLPTYTLYPDGKHGKMKRHCTADFKIDLVRRESKRIAGKGVSIISWLGISADEAHRMKTSPDKRIEHRYPLVELGITRQTCLGWMKARGFPRPPRSACVYCPFHDDTEWLRLKQEDPESFAFAVGFEKNLQVVLAKCGRLDSVPFLHDSRIPLEQVDLEAGAAREQMGFSRWGNECEGYCGV